MHPKTLNRTKTPPSQDRTQQLLMLITLTHSHISEKSHRNLKPAPSSYLAAALHLTTIAQSTPEYPKPKHYY